MRNEIEDGFGCAGLVPTKAEASAEDAFRREREANERLQAENIRLRNTIAGVRAALIPLCNQPVPNVQTIRDVVQMLRQS